MINRGRYAGYYLYEITHQDLMLQGEATIGYQSGNILIYADRDDIQLGTQIALADDLAAAHEYLDHSGAITFKHSKGLEQKADSLEQQTQTLEDEVARLTRDIARRDELLRDISGTLSIQRDHNEFLTEQLRAAQERLTVDELTREELMADLQNISQETYNIETTLEETLLEKDELEQELAASITNFIELNFQNSDMQRRLDELHSQSLEQLTAEAGTAGGAEAAAGTTTEGGGVARAEAPTAELAAAEAPQAEIVSTSLAAGESNAVARLTEGSGAELEDNPHLQTITMSSGKQIHIYHQFPTPARRSAQAHIFLTSRAILRTILIAVVSLVIILFFSIFATAQLNQISMGKALDILLGSLGLA